MRILVAFWLVAVALAAWPAPATALDEAEVRRVTDRGLEWLAGQQSRVGHWAAQRGQYPAAMTALAGMALLCEGSTTTQGRYAPHIRLAADYLLRQSQPNGLIGDPRRDDKYIYGHGFSLLFLSHVLGEEEDAERREELVDVLTRAAIFCGLSQTNPGGWGYVSSRDGGGFDEGSTTVTQVQGLRAARNAGIPVPSEIVEKAIGYIRRCTTPDGGVQYNSAGGGGRPAITAAAITCLFSAGEYDSEYVPKLLGYAKKHLFDISSSNFGFWHYAHYYYAQVLYREGGNDWVEYRNRLFARLISEVNAEGYWSQGHIGPVYTTSLNLTILQIEKGVLPIYQR